MHLKYTVVRSLLLIGLLGALAALFVVATPDASVDQVTDSASHQAKPAATTDAETKGGTGSPVENFKLARFQRAIRGLNYDSGIVERGQGWRQVLAEIPAHEDTTVALTRGASKLERGMPVLAIQAYTRAVLLDPENPSAYLGLGTALFDKGETDKAIAAFRTALQFDPEMVEARYQLAVGHWRNNDLATAADSLRDVVQAKPNHAKGQERLAVLTYYMGDYQESWLHVHACEALGATVPPQFRFLLAGKLVEPPS